MRKYSAIACAILSLVSFIMFFKSEYDGGVYADVHGTVGSIFDTKSAAFFCLFLVFALASVWFRKRQVAKD